MIGQKLAFNKGDVIFGRRRAYQRKLAIAKMDGICSAHAMVLRAKPDVMLPEFLPFFLSSDMFMERAIGISVGSLSPTINWRTLKKEEFPVPPLPEQRRLARLLWAADEVVEKWRELLKRCEQAYQSLIKEKLFSNSHKSYRVAEMATLNPDSLSVSETSSSYTFRYLDIGSVEAPKKVGVLTTMLFKDAPSRARRIVYKGDILLSTVRPNLRSFTRIDFDAKDIIASTGFCVVRPKKQNTGILLYHAFFSRKFSNYCEARVTGTNYPAISATDIGKFTIHIPSNENELSATCQSLESMDASINRIQEHIQRAMLMRSGILSKYMTAEATHV